MARNLIVKVNASHGADYLIKDTGITIPSSGTVTFEDIGTIKFLQGSAEFRTKLTDAAYDGGTTSTLQMEYPAEYHVSGTVDQADAINWLDGIELGEGGEDWGYHQNREDGTLFHDLVAGGTQQLTNWLLGSHLDGQNLYTLTSIVASTQSGNPISHQQMSSVAPLTLSDTGSGVAGTSTYVSKADHRHPHGNLIGEGESRHHIGSQVGLTGTYSNIGSPDDVEQLAIELDARIGAAGAKYEAFGQPNKVQSNVPLYMLGAGSVPTSAAPQLMHQDGNIASLSAVVNAADAANGYKFYAELQVGGLGSWSEIAAITLSAGSTSTYSTSGLGTAAYSAGDYIRYAAVRVDGSDSKSDFDNMAVRVGLNES